MLQKLIAPAIIGAALLMIPAKANATTFTYDCLISSSTQSFDPNTGCVATASVGTFTYNDATGAGTIDLTGTADGAKTLTLYLNLNPNLTFTENNFSISGDATNVDCNGTGNPSDTTCVANFAQADGFQDAGFDLEVTINTFEPTNFTLLYNGQPLDLNFLSSPDATLSTALHIGGFTPECSEFVGSLAAGVPDTTSTTGLCGGGDGDGGGDGGGSPEPASMLLFGLGALATASRARRLFARN